MDGQNALELDDDDLWKMQRDNYRRIQFKLENRFYIKFTAEMIEKLKEIVSKTFYNHASLGNASFPNFNSQSEVEGVFRYLHGKAPGFFGPQEPEATELGRESFFEQKRDAGSILMPTAHYADTKFTEPDKIDVKLEKAILDGYGIRIKCVCRLPPLSCVCLSNLT